MPEAPRSPHIALLADPGTGHLIPFTALAKHLLTKQNLSITLITQPTALSSTSHQSILKTLPQQINVISLPQLPAESIPKGTMPNESSLIIVTHNLVHLRDVLKSLTSTTAANPVTALIVDMFSIIALDVAREIGLAAYLFFTSNCLCLYLSYYLPAVVEATVTGELRDLAEPMRLPGCVPIRGRDMPEAFHDRKRQSYCEFVQFLKLFRLPKGILVNSFEELEPGPLKVMRADESLPPFYPVGPLVRSASCESERPAWLKWLDEQPAGSVIYVSFGSGGTLSRDQMDEVAFGLQMSGQRFLWVVKSPSESESSADYLGVRNSTGPGPVEFLPAGFVERTRQVGFLLPVWAPQMEVLSHEATGGFVTHCGWNSVLESIVSGVPMVAWPLYAEQAVNAVILADDLKVAVRVGAGGKGGVVGREEIARLVRGVIEGEEGTRLRSRVKEVRDAAAAALEDGGSSYGSCSEIVREWGSLVSS